MRPGTAKALKVGTRRTDHRLINRLQMFADDPYVMPCDQLRSIRHSTDDTVGDRHHGGNHAA